MKKSITLSVASLICLASASLHAASVQFTLDLSTAGMFQLYAQELDGDNGGIASYSAVLTGGITSLDHASPNVATAQSTVPAFGAAGFTFLRSADEVTTVSGSQDTIAPTPNLIYGFGQEANSFAGLGLTPLTPVTDPVSWDANLLLASGEWSGEEPNVDMGAALTLANVFSSTSGAATQAATLSLVIEREPIGTPGLEATYVGPGADLSEGLQGAFASRGYGPIVLSDAVMLSNKDGDLADLSPIADLVFTTSDGGPTGTLTDNDGDGKYDIMIDAAFSSMDPGTAIAGSLDFSTQVAGADPSSVSMPFSIAVPEPSTVALSCLALVGLVGFARRK